MALSWSFSRLGDFEKCRRMFMLKHIDRIPEPERVLKPGQTEFANDRGTRVHGNIEEYVRGDHDDLCPEANKHFGLHIDLLRHLHADGMVIQEQEWAFDKEWEVTEWAKGWVRMKLDFLVHWSPTHATAGDWKTGRVYGNEVTHAQQLQLYAMSAFLRYPELEVVTAADFYIDHGEITERSFTRSQSLRFRKSFTDRGLKVTESTKWPAAGNRWSCRWCPYKHTEHCDQGVD